MILHPIPQSQLSVLVPVFKLRIEEACIEGATPEDLVEKLKVGYDNRFAAAYADDLVEPKNVLIMSHLPSALSEETVAYINLMWSHPDVRGKEDVNVFFATAEKYGRFHGATLLCGSSWRIGSARPTDDLWVSKGFTIQETIYQKKLTEI